MGRPLRGSNRDEFYAALDSVSSKAIDGQLPSSIDSAFQLQEYISALVRDDPHNVERIVRIPKRDDKEKEKEKDRERDESEVDEYCWIYEQLRRLALDLTYPLVDKLQECCSRQSCPEMKAGEWLYLCVAHGSGSAGFMEKCCAIDYILHTIDSATALLNSPKAFPSRISIPYQSRRHFPSLARRLGRIFAHAYFHHREEFTAAEEQNSLYARFLALAKRFDLVPAEFLVIPVPQDGSKQGETNENANANVGGNENDHQQGESSSFSSQEPVDPTVPSQQGSGSNANSSPVSSGGNSNPNSPSGLSSRSPRNRLRTDTMYLSGTFHERGSGISSGAAGNGLESSPTRRVSSPLAATLASQEEEDERAESAQSQSQSRAEGSATVETFKDPESAHPDQATDTTALSSVPVMVSNAPVQVLVRDFAIETVAVSGSASESPSGTTFGLEDSPSTAEAEITIPVPPSKMFIPPIVVNAPEVVITNPDGLDSTSQHHHPTYVTEVSAEDEEEENPDVDDLEHALENDDSEEDADDGDDEEEEEEEEHEAAIGANMALPESDIASAAAIEVRFEEIAPEPERKEEEEEEEEEEKEGEEEHETEDPPEPEPSPAMSTLDETSAEPSAEPPTESPAESNSHASQDPDTAVLDISIDNSVAEVDAYLIGSQNEDEEDDDLEHIPAISSAPIVSDDGTKDAEKVEAQHSEDLSAVAASSEDVDDVTQSQSQAPNDTSALEQEQVASEPSTASSPADSAIEQKSTTDAGEAPEIEPELNAPTTVSADPSISAISETNAGEEEK